GRRKSMRARRGISIMERVRVMERDPTSHPGSNWVSARRVLGWIACAIYRRGSAKTSCRTAGLFRIFRGAAEQNPPAVQPVGPHDPATAGRSESERRYVAESDSCAARPHQERCFTQVEANAVGPATVDEAEI